MNPKLRSLRPVARNLRRMLSLAWRMDPRLTRRYYLTAMVGALGPVFAGLTLATLIDTLGGHRVHEVWAGLPLVVILAAHYFVLIGTSVVRHALNESYYDYLFRYALQNELTYRFNEKLSQLDVEHLESPEVQKLIIKTRETHTWRVPDFLRILSFLVLDAVSVAVAAVALVPYGAWMLGVLALASVPRLYLRARLGELQWSMYGSGAPQARKLWYLGSLLSDDGSLREMKVFRTSAAVLERYRRVQQELLALNSKPLHQSVRISLVAPLLEGATVFALAYWKVPEVVAGTMTVGAFAFFVAMLQQLAISAGSFGVHAGVLYENSLFVDYFFDLLALPKLIREDPAKVAFEPIRPPRIEFRNVSFTYPSGHTALEDVSFVVEPGRSVALVGVNGAGKSTIIKLICRFYDATRGEILVNGVDIRRLDLRNWYQHLGTLFQDFVRYKLTVRENIVLGDPDRAVREEEIRAAARKAGAASFIERLPRGYDQVLGREFDDGEQLSGGQWQKLAIARAFYHSAPVLIMDEPTSAIDAEAEYEIFNALEQEYRDKTLILVSHRFSTVRNADSIVVIDQRRAVERGTHEELMARRGKYAAMFQAQAAGYR